jgi:hypothetical protein
MRTIQAFVQTLDVLFKWIKNLFVYYYITCLFLILFFIDGDPTVGKTIMVLLLLFASGQWFYRKFFQAKNGLSTSITIQNENNMNFYEEEKPNQKRNSKNKK